MFMELERLGKTTEDLKRLEYDHYTSFSEYLLKEGAFNSVEEADNDPQPWKKMDRDSRFGGQYNRFWMRVEVTVPAEMEGKEVTLVVPRCFENIWHANPEYLLYINGVYKHGMDENHEEVLLTECAKAGTKFQLDFHAYIGISGEEKHFFFRPALTVINKPVRELRYNIAVPGAIVKNLNDYNPARSSMMNALNETINKIDFFAPRSEAFYASIKEANDYIVKELYQKQGGHNDMVASVIGHTHIDVTWLWTLQTTREKTSRSFSTVLDLMNEYPEYKFMSSQPQLYEFFKERNPEKYEEMKKRIEEGRWEVEGGMWVEADCNIPSGESFVRQFLFGKRFFKEEFNKDNKIMWLPDVFGYSAALPQIMKKCGIDYFMTTKINWNSFNKLPADTFDWEGIDGSKVLTHFITTTEYAEHPTSFFTTYNGYLNPENVMGAWQRYQQKSLNNDVLMCVGYGDGGGGTTKEMIENARRMDTGLPSCPKVEWKTSRDYFDQLKETFSHAGHHMPVWVGELYFELHRGTLTSMARNKKYNRKSEFLYQDLENLATIATYIGQKYPQERINENWKLILLNQFHDILPGSSIKEVYDESKDQYEAVLAAGREMLGNAVSGISSNIKTAGPSVIVYNTMSYERNDIASFAYKNVDSVYVVDSNGNKLPCQKTDVKEDGTATFLFFAKGVPSKGYQSYTICEGTVAGEAMAATTEAVENRFFSVKFANDGTFASVYDKVAGREMMKDGERANMLVAYEDRPALHENWEVDLYYQEKFKEVNDVKSIKVTENGPVRTTIRIERDFGKSVIVQDIRFYNDINRIDFDTFADWKESQVLLKAQFPVDVHTTNATYDIQFGNLERTTHNNTSWDVARFEVCGHKWADLSEDNYGVSVMNDCKYGYDIKENNIRLTLLKCGIWPNAECDKEQHQFVYSLYPHTGTWKEAETAKMAYNLNVPLIADVTEGNPEGTLKESFSLLSLDADNVVLETVKKAEDNDDMIIRFYEYKNRRSDITISFCNEIAEAYECDMLENNIAPAAVNGKDMACEIKPYEIKTYRIVLKK